MGKKRKVLSNEAVRNLTFTYFVNDSSPKEVCEQVLALFPDLSFYIAQAEKCPASGRRHLQGYLQLANRHRPSAVSRKLQSSGLSGIHIEPARGRPSDNVKYCSKSASSYPGESPYQWGTIV